MAEGTERHLGCFRIKEADMFDILSYILGKKSGTIVIESNDEYTVTDDGEGNVTIEKRED